ncbi:MAG: hypothetical protein ACXWT0_00170 [Methylobacter sp.]
MKTYRHFIVALMIPLLIGLSFSASAKSIDADYGPYHQTSFSAADVLVPTHAAPERISTAVMARSELLGKMKAVDSVNDKVARAGYKDRPGWFMLSAH